MPIQEGGRWSPTQQIVSPGVFTRENDLSGLAQGVANIGGAIVAPFADGPAFYPNIITDVATLEQRFGIADGVYYGPYTAKEYLIQQGVVTIVRVGGLTGYWQKNPLVVYAEPGQWLRTADIGALTTASFMYLNSDDYTANIQYVHSASSWEIQPNALTRTNPLAGIWITGSNTTNQEIADFVGANSSLPDINSLSASLVALKDAYQLVSLTTYNADSAFSASIVDNGLKVTPSGGGSDYALAWFDVTQWAPSGYIFKSGSGAFTSILIDSGITGNIVAGFPAGSGSYLTASVTKINNQQVKFPFVVLDTSVGANAKLCSHRETGANTAFSPHLYSTFD